MTVTEEWRPIAGFEANYKISSNGQVWSRKRQGSLGGLLRQHPNRWGYMQVNLTQDSRVYNRRVHRMVAAAFLGPCPAGLEVRHLDGNAANNAVGNLRYGTKSENAQDRLRHGHHDQANKTHCPQKHEYDEANTRYDRRGSRYCLACKREKRRAERARRKAARLSP